MRPRDARPRPGRAVRRGGRRGTGVGTAASARAAERAGPAGQARRANARAEQLPSGPGTFTVATFGNSFHWRDREQVAATVHDLLRPGGAAVLLADWKAEPRTASGLPHPPLPQDAVDALVRAYPGPVRRAPGAACCRTERPAASPRSSPGPVSRAPNA
ncbi:class I SAM-dependent methyltransferase [Kitasatospora griseola]